MTIHTDLQFASLDELFLDPMNPRLGRKNTRRDVPQEQVLDLMRSWTLEELAVSYLESGGFWTHEALLVAQEELYGDECLVVIEGNRRLAALKLLRAAYAGNPSSRKWAQIAGSAPQPPGLFERIPYILVDHRDDVANFLGFRHVTGIKQWNPAEKAEFIAKMIDEQGLDYTQVMRRIGSNTPTVRQLYIAYRLLLQIDARVEGIPDEALDERFSVMYLSLRTPGVQQYLRIDVSSSPENAKNPVPADRGESLNHFAEWLFGSESAPPLFTDSRRVDDFGRLLLSPEAVEYLERSDRPRFEVAYRLAGGDESEIIALIETAADDIELSLTRVHLYRKSPRIRKAVRRVGLDVIQLLAIFPDIQEEVLAAMPVAREEAK